MNRFILVLTLAIMGLTACTQKDISQLSDSQKTSRIEGGWRITLFQDKNGTETHDFSDHSFDFAKDGSFVANVNGQTYTGTYDFGKDDGLNRIYVTITGTNKLDQLTEHWVLSQLETKSMTWTDDKAGSAERVEWQKL